MIALDADRCRAALASLEAGRAAAGPLAALRAAALDALLARGLPDTREEDWRYTNLEEFAHRSQASLLPEAAPPAAGQELAPWSAADGVPVRLCIRDGIFRPGISSAPGVPGLGWSSLGSGHEDVLPALAAGHVPGQSPLLDLNTAFLSDGLVLRVGAGSTPAAPVLIDVARSGAPARIQPRIVLELAAGAEVTVVLWHRGGGPAPANLVTDVRCAGGSRLRLIRVQDLGDDALQVESTRVELAGAATAELATLDLGGRLSRHDLSVVLAGAGAGVSLHGLFLGRGAGLVDNHTTIEHRAPDTRSREIVHGIVGDEARGVFNGRVIVRPGAVRSDAALTNRNLILARTAEVDTKPELQIYADDVRCSHGATTGQLDPASLFYLRSRGIDEAEARRILVGAFARAILSSVGLGGLRDELAGLLDRRLGGNAP